MRSRAKRHFSKMLQSLPVGLGLVNIESGPNLLVLYNLNKIHILMITVTCNGEMGKKFKTDASS